MSEYVVNWETCFCENDYLDEAGVDIVKADSEEEAVEKVRAAHYHSVAWIECKI